MDIETNFVHIDGEFIFVALDLRIYSLLAIQKAAHTLTNRCVVHLQYQDENIIHARFRHRAAEVESTPAVIQQAVIQPAVLRQIAENFLNQVLDFTLREQIGSETEGVRNLILAHALSRTSLLHPELEDADPELDHLGIAKSDIAHPRPLNREN